VDVESIIHTGRKDGTYSAGTDLSESCTLRHMDALMLVRVRHLSRSGAGRRVREAAGLTRAEVGRAIGASGAAVSRWEDGTRAPTGTAAARYLRLLEKLAAMTGTPLDEHPGVPS
jgi:DNA-binding transcriptional regulator YiaG